MKKKKLSFNKKRIIAFNKKNRNIKIKWREFFNSFGWCQILKICSKLNNQFIQKGSKFEKIISINYSKF